MNAGGVGIRTAQSADLAIYNSTVSDHSLGAIEMFSSGDLSVKNVTISGNSTGILLNSSINSSHNIQNTIITNNAGADCAVTTSTLSFLGSHNLIDDHASGPCATIADAAVTNFDTTARDNGGNTFTHALLAGSNALAAADSSVCSDSDVDSIDQRTVIRPQGNGCDIGAYESELSGSENENVAFGKTASQSSTGFGAVASRAVDGNTDGVWSGGSVSRTNTDTNAWWKVDLGASHTIDEIVLWGRTGCCALANYTVYVSDSDINPSNPTANGATSYAQTANPNPSLTIPVNRSGRYVMVRLNGTDILSMAEVQVFGTPVTSPVNVAQGKSASQSSTYSPAAASRAVDGNTDGVWAGGSVSRTNTDTNAWWKVDLGAIHTINEIVLWGRTGCCALANYTVYVSDSDINPSNPTANGATSYAQTANPNPSLTIPVNRSGRYVMVRLNGTDILSMAEVQVFGTPVTSPVNVAQGKSASQSSTYSPAAASRAVDGNTDGVWAGGSVSRTNTDTNAWWKVDLGAIHTINEIVLWGRTGCCALANYTVYVSDSDISASNPTANGATSYAQTANPNPSLTIPVNRSGRYVMVRLNGTDILSMAEVQIFGTPGGVSGASSSAAPTLAEENGAVLSDQIFLPLINR